MLVERYNKGQRVRLSTNFVSTEFDCKCSNPDCTHTMVSETLVGILQSIRNESSSPMYINSGYRCSKHNAAVGGATSSYHMQGRAADVRVEGKTPLEVAQMAEKYGATGIIVYENFTHIDDRPNKYFAYDGGSTVGTFFVDESKQRMDSMVKELKEILAKYGY